MASQGLLRQPGTAALQVKLCSLSLGVYSLRPQQAFFTKISKKFGVQTLLDQFLRHVQHHGQGDGLQEPSSKDDWGQNPQVARFIAVKIDSLRPRARIFS